MSALRRSLPPGPAFSISSAWTPAPVLRAVTRTLPPATVGFEGVSEYSFSSTVSALADPLEGAAVDVELELGGALAEEELLLLLPHPTRQITISGSDSQVRRRTMKNPPPDRRYEQ